MYFTYVLLSKKDNQFYTGYTNSLKRRLKEHREGRVSSTQNRLPVSLVYFECCTTLYDALAREKYLKSGMGKRFLKKRLKYFLNHRN